MNYLPFNKLYESQQRTMLSNPDVPLDLSKKLASASLQPPTHHNYNLPNFMVKQSSVCLSPNSQTDSCDSDFSDRMRVVLPASNQTLKVPRPFKAFSKEPMSLALGASMVHPVLELNNSKAYEEFKEKMLARVRTDYTTNKNMKRNNYVQYTEIDDSDYQERRRKNNEAAKRSRDARKAKEDEITIRCAFLEQENMQLKLKISSAEEESKRLQNVLKSLQVN